jgi:hypothetical protein
MVREEDAETARKLLEENIPEKVDAELTGGVRTTSRKSLTQRRRGNARK